MNTQFFKYALEVERTRSITQAAENLLIAQPNLSKALREAEDALGYSIFERTSRGVVPTEKGTRFLAYAREIVKQLRHMEEIAGSGVDGAQRLSVSMPRGSYISKALVRFAGELDRSLGMELNIIETGSMQTINDIVEGKFHLGIIRYQTAYEQYFLDYMADKSLASELIWGFSYLALMSEQHPLARRDTISPSELAQYIEIVHGDNVIPYLAPDKFLPRENGDERAQKRIFLYERANQFELLYSIPESFMWVSPIPEDMLSRYSLVQRRCDFPGEANSYKDVLIYRKDYELSALDRRFIDRVYESKNEVALREYK